MAGFSSYSLKVKETGRETLVGTGGTCYSAKDKFLAFLNGRATVSEMEVVWFAME